MASELPVTAPEPVSKTPWQRWVGFWFPAADPTTLGFIRIATGLLVLYIHLAYSVDLQQFFGKHGWYSAAFIERERKEYPWQASPFWSWDPEPVISAKVPDFPHRRKAVVDFIRALPEDEAKRKASLEFLRQISASDDPEQPDPGAELVPGHAHLPGAPGPVPERAGHRRGAEAGPEPADPGPAGVPHDPPPAARERAARDVRAFWDVLPDGRATPAPGRTCSTTSSSLARRCGGRSSTSCTRCPPTRPSGRSGSTTWTTGTTSRTRRCAPGTPSSPSGSTSPTRRRWRWSTPPSCSPSCCSPSGCSPGHVGAGVGRGRRVHPPLAADLFGMDTMMNILLFYLMIGNSGAALSVDRLIARYRAARASLARSGTIDSATQAFLAVPPRSRGAGFALRLIQVHFCIIYLASGLAKLKGPRGGAVARCGTWW
jgi:hypothetical protein